MPLNRIVLYVKDVEQTVAFYEKYFGFKRSGKRAIGSWNSSATMVVPVS